MKKKLTLLVALLAASYLSHAQTSTLNLKDSSTMTMQRWRDSSFALLNLSATQILSGYLIDYALNEFNDSNFNSLISVNIDTIADVGSFFALHNILTASVVNANAISESVNVVVVCSRGGNEPLSLELFAPDLKETYHLTAFFGRVKLFIDLRA